MSGNPLNNARGLNRASKQSPSVYGASQWGTVTSINSTNHTVDVILDNSPSGVNPTTVPNIPYLSSYTPKIGDAVLISRGQGSSRTSRIIVGVPFNGPTSPTTPSLWSQAAYVNVSIASSATEYNYSMLSIVVPVEMVINVSGFATIECPGNQFVSFQLTLDGVAYGIPGSIYPNNGLAAVGYYTIPTGFVYGVVAGTHTLGWTATCGEGGTTAILQREQISVISGKSGAT